MPVPVAEVLIKGGAHVVQKKGELITPMGVRTLVTDEQLEILQQNEVFKIHTENGFLTVDNQKRNPDNVAKNMNAKDPSRPKTGKDLKDEFPTTKITVGKPSEE